MFNLYCYGSFNVESERTEVLQQQWEILQTFFEHIPVMVMFHAQTGHLLLANRHLENALGWSLAELANLDWLKESYPESDNRQNVWQHIQAATGKWQDFKTRCKDGRYIVVAWAYIRLSDNRTIGIGEDISDR